MFKPPHATGINYVEFDAYFKYIYRWKEAFHLLDRDCSGTIGIDELANGLIPFFVYLIILIAFRGYGLEFHPHLMILIMKRYDFHKNGCLLFDEFLNCLSSIKVNNKN